MHEKRFSGGLQTIQQQSCVLKYNCTSLFLLRNTLEYIRYFGISNIDIFPHCENSTGVGNVFSIDFECKIHHLSYIVNIKKKDDIIFCMIDDLLK